MFELTDSPIVNQGATDASCGACVVFTGLVRNHNEGREVLSLDYEAMPGVALKEGNRILEEALSRFKIASAHCVHRVGELKIGDTAVQVTVASAHRGESFAACMWIIDEVKKRVPIWKREHYADGTIEWVNAAEQPSECSPAVLIDTADELQSWFLIDVRDEDEIAEDPIRPFDSVVSPVARFDRGLLRKGRPLLVCASGIRALILADDLRREGITEVWSLTGGCKTLKQLAKKRDG